MVSRRARQAFLVSALACAWLLTCGAQNFCEEGGEVDYDDVYELCDFDYYDYCWLCPEEEPGFSWGGLVGSLLPVVLPPTTPPPQQQYTPAISDWSPSIDIPSPPPPPSQTPPPPPPEEPPAECNPLDPICEASYEAYVKTPDENCACAPSVYIQTRFPDLSYDDWTDEDSTAFAAALAARLNIPQSRVIVTNVDPGSVVITAVIVPKAGNEGSFDSLEPQLLDNIASFLSSRNLAGFGEFTSYSTNADAEVCGRLILTKPEVQELVEYTYCTRGEEEGDKPRCSVIWGLELFGFERYADAKAEVLSSGFDGGAVSTSELFYQSVTNLTLQTEPLDADASRRLTRQMVEVLSEPGLEESVVDMVGDLDVQFTCGIANYSTKSCTDCACKANRPSFQPYIFWYSV